MKGHSINFEFFHLETNCDERYLIITYSEVQSVKNDVLDWYGLYVLSWTRLSDILLFITYSEVQRMELKHDTLDDTLLWLNYCIMKRLFLITCTAS